MEPPVAGWRGPGSPGDDREALLRAFFRAELPHPWPNLSPPEPAAMPARNGLARQKALGRWLPALGAGVRSRLALAATVGLLLLGTLLLSGRFHVPTPDASTGPGFAKPINDFIIKESLLQEVDEKPGPDGTTVKQEQPTQYRIDFYAH
jgi:hypothetical protein